MAKYRENSPEASPMEIPERRHHGSPPRHAYGQQYSVILGLQRSAGNEVVNHLLKGHSTTGSVDAGLNFPLRLAPSQGRNVGAPAPTIHRLAGPRVVTARGPSGRPPSIALSPASPRAAQRRTPGLDEIDKLDTEPATLKKLRKTVLRTFQDQTPFLQSYIALEFGKDVAAYIQKADVNHLKSFIGRMETDIQWDHEVQEMFRTLGTDDEPSAAPVKPAQYPGAARTFVPYKTLLSKPEQETFEEIVAEVISLITTSGADDAALSRVFGDEEKWAKWAKPMFAAAATRVKHLLDSDLIGFDMSGESEQMFFAGLTNPDGMKLAAGFLEDLKKGKRDDCLHTLCHETFHTAHANIRDHGGYRKEASFGFRLPKDKLFNAEHYVEVVAQLHWGSEVRTLRAPNPVLASIGGFFTKAAAALTGDPDATPVPGHSEAVDILRNSWVQALNIHGPLKDLQAKQDKNDELTAEEQLNLTYWSRVLGLTIHDRVVDGSADLPTVGDLDLALSEGVTRRLSQAYVAAKLLPHTKAAYDDAYHLPTEDREAVTKHLVEQALKEVGPIRKNLVRDKAMVDTLNGLFQGEIKPTKGFRLPKA